MIGAIILQVILIALNAVFTCAETAIVSLNDNQLEEMAKKDEAKAALLSGFKAKQERFLTAMQLVSMASVCLGSAYAALVFRKPLEDFIGKSGLVSEQSLAPIPIKEENEKKPDVIAQASRKEAKWKRLYEGQQLLNKKLKIALFAAVVLLVGFVVINFRFEYSIFTYFTNYKANMEEELIDKYERWEERLQQKEDSLNQ